MGREERYFAALLGKTLAELAPLIEKAAGVLDHRGSRALRNRIESRFNYCQSIHAAMQYAMDRAPGPLAEFPDPEPPRRPDRLRLVVDNEPGR